MGNPADVVEVRADLLLAAVEASGKAVGHPQERVEWWLEMTDDEYVINSHVFRSTVLSVPHSTFVLQTDCEVPDELISLVLLLMLPASEWEKAQKRDKLPKPKINLEIVPIIISVIGRRLAEYPTTMEVSLLCVRSCSRLINPRSVNIGGRGYFADYAHRE